MRNIGLLRLSGLQRHLSFVVM